MDKRLSDEQMKGAVGGVVAPERKPSGRKCEFQPNPEEQSGGAIHSKNHGAVIIGEDEEVSVTPKGSI